MQFYCWKILISQLIPSLGIVLLRGKSCLPAGCRQWSWKDSDFSAGQPAFARGASNLNGEDYITCCSSLKHQFFCQISYVSYHRRISQLVISSSRSQFVILNIACSSRQATNATLSPAMTYELITICDKLHKVVSQFATPQT